MRRLSFRDESEGGGGSFVMGIVGHPQHFGEWVRKKGEGTTSLVMAEI
jgi:hypothetical protein